MTDERIIKLVYVIENATYLMKEEWDAKIQTLFTRVMINDILEYFKLTTGRELEEAEAEEKAKLLKGEE